MRLTKILIRFTVIWIFIFAIQSTSMALDDISSLRCDGGIIAPGDSEQSVRDKCGEPQKVFQPDPRDPVKWVYDFGGTRFKYYVSIVNGKVERIQSGEYGD